MKISDYFRLLLLAAIWGASFLFMKVAAPLLGAIPTAFFRVLLAAIGLAVILAVLRVKCDFKGKFKSALILGVLNSGIPFLMYCIAATLLPAGYSAILNATTPMMGVLVGFMFFGEGLSAKKLLGVFIGFFGIASLMTTGPAIFTSSVLIGVLACMVATTCYGVAGFLTKRWISDRGGLDAKLVAFGSQVGATLVLLPFFGASVAIQPPPTWGDAHVWMALSALGLLCTACAYILFFRLIADIGPIRSLTVTFLIPPFGVLWGVLFLGEQVSKGHLIGGAFICVAIWLVLAQNKTAPSLADIKNDLGNKIGNKT